MAITNASKLASYVGAAITADGASGIITATQFVGDGSTLTGIAATDDISTSSLVVVGISTLGNVTAGVVTANQFVGNITGTAATFTGNVTVGGTLTYDDVTNIDSLGIVTARTGIQVLAGGINAVGVVTATSFSGSGADLTNLNIPSSFTELDATLFG